MTLKLLLTIFLFFNISYASFQKVSIGKIDSYYKNKISKTELRRIILEIEQTFESRLGVNVFDYSDYNGKPINIIYMPPTRLEKSLNDKKKRLDKKLSRINYLKEELPKQRDIVIKKKKVFEKENKIHNENIKKFNAYVAKQNKKREMSTSEYNKVQKYVSKKNNEFQKTNKQLKRSQKNLKYLINKFNNKIVSYNNEISSYNRLSQEIESISRSLKKVRGRTFGLKEVTYKTYYKNGKRVKEKSLKTSMNKIEIYGFDNRGQLKALIAHEIGHLIGLPHIRAKNALMNPILQKNQEKNLTLTYEDIKNFKENF